MNSISKIMLRIVYHFSGAKYLNIYGCLCNMFTSDFWILMKICVRLWLDPRLNIFLSLSLGAVEIFSARLVLHMKLLIRTARLGIQNTKRKARYKMCFIPVLAGWFRMYDPHSLNVQFHKYKAMKSQPLSFGTPVALWDSHSSFTTLGHWDTVRPMNLTPCSNK